ncbi:response regulator transcription factor [Paenibacillus sp. chi10]|uniref:Response regulator transcription factor n=1 Tax=Paenibacillus suaedae TaxID=3077233 RepID=A0AAJ2JXD8_9BACL|nr:MULTISPECIES: response regulator transcription factor [unclassified Paenibacillus]MDT8977494.1 response regulator transcription factor [Paenibacillus sp. chi10]GAV14712.1 transcriptional regulatory protein YycF [Paenibacillus sp. NAIST15-1]
MSTILLVEDDEALGLAIEFSLKNEGYEVVKASSVKEAKQEFDRQPFDLIILDIGLPDGNGYDLCMHFKKHSDTSVIFLTALDEEANVVMGLDIGGDDYITKPFRVKELMSRVKVQLRKQARLGASSTILTSENIKIDMNLVKVYKNHDSLPVTNLEYKLLLTFMMNAHKALKRDELLSNITEGDEVFFDENTLSVYIRRLRDKVEGDPKNPQFIVTQRGLGYRWSKDVNRE